MYNLINETFQTELYKNNVNALVTSITQRENFL
jgi:hypothetical protein